MSISLQPGRTDRQTDDPNVGLTSLTDSERGEWYNLGCIRIPESQESQELQELHRHIEKIQITAYTKSVSFPCSNNDATVHHVFQYYFRFATGYDAKFEIPK